MSKEQGKSVISHHTQLWISTRVHSYTCRWKHYVMNSASLIPGCLRSAQEWGMMGRGWIKVVNLRWDQWRSGQWEWSWRSNSVCAATDMYPAAWERSQSDKRCFRFMLLTQQPVNSCISRPEWAGLILSVQTHSCLHHKNLNSCLNRHHPPRNFHFPQIAFIGIIFFF